MRLRDQGGRSTATGPDAEPLPALQAWNRDRHMHTEPCEPSVRLTGGGRASQAGGEQNRAEL